MRVRASAVFAVMTVALVSGCATVQREALVHAADDRLEQARAQGADQTSPYEFYEAKSELTAARRTYRTGPADQAFRQADQAATLPP